MPLKPGKSKAVVSQNIREMVAAGHPQRQAVAAALENARHHSTAQNVQSFDDHATFTEAPPGIGNPNAASVKMPPVPRNPGSPKATVMADGTASPRETVKTQGPTAYATPPIMGNTGPIKHRGKFTSTRVDTFGDGTEVTLTPSGLKAQTDLPGNTDTTNAGSSAPSE